jgi:ligand-binding sensor domain-containing protein
MSIKRLVSLTFFILIALEYLLSAYTVTYLTANVGLSRNHVNHIYKDSRGFIWFSTTSGVDRYDGYDFLHFSGVGNGHQYPLKVVNCVEEDAEGNLWIASENGLFCHDYKTGQLYPLSPKIKSEIDLSGQFIRYLKCDTHGNMWVVHSSGLSLIMPTENGNYYLQPLLRSSTVETLCFVGNSVYIGDNNNIIRMIPDNGGVYKRVDTPETLRNLNGIITVIFFENNYLWVGTSMGLHKFNLNTEETFYYTHDPNNKNSLSSNTITDIAINSDGEVLVATLIGLNIYNQISNDFRRINTDSANDGTVLNNNFLSSLLVDGKNLWIGTHKGGVNLLRPTQTFFTNLSHIENNPSSLSKKPVNAIFEDVDGDLLIGTVEGGLNIRKKGTSVFIHSTTEQGNPKSLQHNSVSAICQDENKDLWIGTWGNGLSKLKYADKYRPVYQKFNQDSEGRAISSNFVAALQYDSLNKGIWIGTREGLDFLDIEINRFYPVLNNLSEGKSIQLVTGIFIDSDRRLWVGTGNGLYCIYLNKSDVRKRRFAYQHYRYLLTKADSKIVEKINCIHQSRTGTIWLGSNGNGLYSLQSINGKTTIKKFDEKNGLIDNVIYGILEDDTGNLWLSTDKGICAFHPETRNTRSFTVVDGLATNQFYWDAYLKASDGKMYFGHIAGFTVFDPLKFLPAAINNKTEITKMSVLNQVIFPYQSETKRRFINYDKTSPVQLTLKEADKAFSIEFSALNFSFPDKIKYAYRLKGFDQNWKEVPANRRFANFTSLKHGNYELELKRLMQMGQGLTPKTSLQKELYHPISQHRWFILAKLI